MVFLRKKKADKRDLLRSNSNGEQKATRSDDAGKKWSSKRFLGKKSRDAPVPIEAPTPPTSPDSPEAPLSVMVVTTASSSRSNVAPDAPSGENSVSGTTISDLSHSVMQQHKGYYSNPVEIPDTLPYRKELPPPSYATQDGSTAVGGSYADTHTETANTGYTSALTSTDGNGYIVASTADRGTVGFTADPSEVVTNLLGMFEDACKTPFSGQNAACTPDRAQAASPVAPPVWGMAPSEDDDMSQLYVKREPMVNEPAVDKPGVDKPGVDKPGAGESAAEESATNAPSPDTSSYHENFELVLEEDSLKDTKRKRLPNWMRKKKNDEKEATYLAVFGADPENETKKSSLVKRMSRALNKIPEENEEDRRREAGVTLEIDTNIHGGGPPDEFKMTETKEADEEVTKEERKAKILSDIRRVTSSPPNAEASTPHTLASKTSSGRQMKLSVDKGKEQETQTSSLGRVRSTPEVSSSGRAAKPQWKSVVDRDTGRTYYYHRLTRQTTWTKPDGFDTQLKMKKVLSKGKDNDVSPGGEATRQVKSDSGVDWVSNTAVATLLGANLAQNNPNGKKKEIRGLLMEMAPPDPSSVDQLIEQYDGREDELLTQLRDLVQPQPFDEPIKNSRSFASSDWSPPVNDEKEESRDIVLDSLPVIPSVSMKGRTRTSTTNATGYTSKTDRTQKISNLAPLSGSIAQASEGNTSLTSDEPPEGATELRIANNAVISKPPKKQAVLRNRELHVEEFTSNSYGLRTERFRGHAIPQKTHKSNPYHSMSETEDDSRYLVDNDMPYQDETDSISALSAPDSDFMIRKEKFENSRRKTLDDAIQNKNWELAAVVTEDMRGVSFDSTEGSLEADHRNKQLSEWTQSELDKFISENDWDAVARYIARMRDSNNAASSSKTNQNEDGSPRKGIGAQSRLQQPEIRHSSSVEQSESSYDSEDYSSSSSYSSGQLRYRKRQEFRC